MITAQILVYTKMSKNQGQSPLQKGWNLKSESEFKIQQKRKDQNGILNTFILCPTILIIFEDLLGDLQV